MPVTYIYPSNAELREVAQTKLPNLVKDRPAFDILPIVTKDVDILRWEQKDNYVGLQQVRGLNGRPGRVARIGAKVYTMTPGVYGEFTTVDELELTRRRPFGVFNGAISIDDLVMECQDQLLGRRLDRIEKIVWDLLTAGTFSVAGPDGVTMHTDTFTLQTASAAVAWATFATATPLKDFRAVQLLSRGYSVSFGADAKAYMNRVTFNNLVANTNTADLAGRRTSGLQTVLTLGEINSVLAGEGLPQIVIFDGGYLDSSGTFQPFIPNSKVVVVGRRLDGAPIGNYVYTRNANNPGLEPGPYMKVVDNEEREVPRLIEVHDGHNGGPIIEFPSAVVILTVS